MGKTSVRPANFFLGHTVNISLKGFVKKDSVVIAKIPLLSKAPSVAVSVKREHYVIPLQMDFCPFNLDIFWGHFSILMNTIFIKSSGIQLQNKHIMQQHSVNVTVNISISIFMSHQL